jgi:hypothetical protein
LPETEILLTRILPRGPKGEELATEIAEVNARLAAEARGAAPPSASSRSAGPSPAATMRAGIFAARPTTYI